MKHYLMIAVTAACLSGCASVIEGNGQIVTIDSNPQCAQCSVAREGKVITTVNCTPQTINVPRRNDDLTITCRKSGYGEAVASADSGVEPWVFGNVLFGLGGLIGWGIDAGTGAYNHYDDVLVTFPTAGQPATSAPQQ